MSSYVGEKPRRSQPELRTGVGEIIASPYPLVDEILEQQMATLCVLSDPPGRLRDGMSVVALTGFLAGRGVQLQIVPVLAGHQRYVDAQQMLSGLSEAEEQQIDAMFQTGESCKDKIKRLFNMVEEFRLSKGQESELARLEQRCPVILLGRPQLYPRAFRRQIEAELPDGTGLIGRFEMADAGAQGLKFWEVRDRYFNLSIPNQPQDRDIAVIRKISGQFARRTFLLLHGTSTLGTMAAVQYAIDRDLAEHLRAAAVPQTLRKYGSVELLVEVDLGSEGHQAGDDKMWATELDPRRMRIVADPAPPMIPAADDWIDRFQHGRDLDSLYRRSSESNGVIRYEAIGIHPAPDSGPWGWFMIGGAMIKSFVEKLTLSLDQRQPVLLTGPTGTGKELAAGIVHQTQVLKLLRRLAIGDEIWPQPVVMGAGFTQFNCAAIEGGLVEAELSGTLGGVATHVTQGRPGLLLGAGEGTVHLDEVHLLALLLQGGLLRAMEAPFPIRPVGMHQEINCAAQIVAAMSEDPARLVTARKLLPEFYARFAATMARLPSLDERPADIPALLAHLAGEPVQITEMALRSLLVGSYPINVRNLFTIIQTAKQHRGKILRITEEDVGAPESYHRILKLVGTPPSATDRVFEFSAVPAIPIRGTVFRLAARALSAIANDDKGSVRPRWKEREDVRGLNASAHSITSVKDSAECFKEALTLIVQEAPDEASRRDLLELLHGLVKERFDIDGRANHECQARKRYFALQVKQCLAKPVQLNHLGLAFGFGPAWVSQLGQT